MLSSVQTIEGRKTETQEGCCSSVPDLLLVLDELLGLGLLEGDGDRRDLVVVRAALQAREHRHVQLPWREGGIVIRLTRRKKGLKNSPSKS